MFGIDIFHLVYYLLIVNTIINFFMMFLNKDFRRGSHIGDLFQLKGLWLVVVMLTPFFLFSKVINSLVKNEKEQARNEKLKSEIRKKNLKKKNRKK